MVGAKARQRVLNVYEYLGIREKGNAQGTLTSWKGCRLVCTTDITLCINKLQLQDGTTGKIKVVSIRSALLAGTDVCHSTHGAAS